MLSLSYAQEDAMRYDDSSLNPIEIKENDLEPYITDKDFDYTETPQDNHIIDAIVIWLSNTLRWIVEGLFGVGKAAGFVWQLLNILPYILLGVLVFLLLKLFLKINANRLKAHRKPIGDVALTEEEKIIKSEDIPSLIKAAIAQNNYRLAIRYYYLLTLKELSNANKINWQPQKTNADYISELTSSTLRQQFKNITRIYDYVWYGEFNIDELEFQHIKTSFDNINKINKQS